MSRTGVSSVIAAEGGGSSSRSLFGTSDDPAGVRGAVIVEFTVAAIPLLMMFFTFTQAAFVYTANLALQHAAFGGARAAAVVMPPNPGNVGTEADVDRAVTLGLGRWADSFSTVQVVKTPPSGPNGLVTVEVRATYRCGVPMGSKIMCGADGQLPMTPIVARYPHQGARYTQ